MREISLKMYCYFKSCVEIFFKASEEKRKLENTG